MLSIPAVLLTKHAIIVFNMISWSYDIGSLTVRSTSWKVSASWTINSKMKTVSDQKPAFYLHKGFRIQEHCRRQCIVPRWYRTWKKHNRKRYIPVNQESCGERVCYITKQFSQYGDFWKHWFNQYIIAIICEFN